MRVLITCGPSFAPIDQVRRVTNFSTGSLGVALAQRLARDGWEVVCLKGVGAVHPDPAAPIQVEHFTTNEDLENRLTTHAGGGNFHAVLHAAALVDYRVGGIHDASGSTRTEGKIPSATGPLTLHLFPAPKVILSLRRLFPTGWIAGWKYEVDGPVEAALARGRRQMATNQTDACVVNGPALGTGFLICLKPDRVEQCPDRRTLIECIAQTLARL